MPKTMFVLAGFAALGLSVAVGAVIQSTAPKRNPVVSKIPVESPAKSPAKAHQKPPQPKLSMHQARAIAHKAAPGKIISSEYEKEGGSWRYSFDIQQKHNVQEIGIDPNTGKIIENKSEGKTDVDRKREAREAKYRKK